MLYRMSTHAKMLRHARRLLNLQLMMLEASQHQSVQDWPFGKESPITVLSKLIANQKLLMELEEQCKSQVQAKRATAKSSANLPKLEMTDSDWQIAAAAVKRWENEKGSD